MKESTFFTGFKRAFMAAGRLPRWLARFSDHVHRRCWERRQYLHLLELDDHLLDDVGLTRNQVGDRLRGAQGHHREFPERGAGRILKGNGRGLEWINGGLW
ncbi:DUF1127 domain-containing protein [Pollutimonas sp. H1-120]|uniref:DUF1127 domain-containing protein n=1 Tax=Pollutimonas sp. H1-120 TaxID=3148824 RepID=UPI003B52CF73